MNKQCKLCKLELPIEDFYKNPLSHDGIDWWCKNCKKNYYKSYNLKDGKLMNRKYKATARFKTNIICNDKVYEKMVEDYKTRLKNISNKYHHSKNFPI